MSALTEFLTARIDEDEARARDLIDNGPEWMEEAVAFGANPDRILAECDAKRRIVGRHTPSSECNNRGCRVAGRSGLHCDYDEEPAPCPDLRDLAAVYASDPDYRQEWRP